MAHRRKRRGKFGRPTNTRPPSRSRRGRSSTGKKKTSAAIRSRLNTIRTKTAPVTPTASPFAVKKRAFTRRRTRVVRPAPPKPTPRRAPSPPPPKPRVVRRITPPPPKVIKSRPAPFRPSIPNNIPLRPKGIVGRRDRGFSDVIKSIPPPRPTPRVSAPVSIPRAVTDAAEYLAAMRERGARMGAQIELQPVNLNQRRGTLQSGPRRAGERGGGFVRDDSFNRRDRDLVLAGNADRDGVLGGGNIPGGPAPRVDLPKPIPTPPIKPAIGRNLTVSVTSSPSNAEVLVNGSPAGVKLTPTILSYTDKQLIGTTKTVTVRKTGYGSNESYSISGRVKEEVKIIEEKVLDFDEPDFIEPSFITAGLRPLRQGRFTGGPREGDIDGIRSFSPTFEEEMRRPKVITRKKEIRTQVFLFNVVHRVDGKIVGSKSDLSISNLFQTIHFDLKKAKVDDIIVDDIVDDDDTTVDDGPPAKKVPELLVLTPDGDNPDGTELTQHYSAVINGRDVRRINSNTFKGKAGEPFSVTLRATDVSNYKIKFFNILKGSIVDENAKGFEKVPAQELSINVDGPVTVLIFLEKVRPILVPSVTISPTTFRYNIAEPISLSLGYDSENCDSVELKLNKTTLKQTDEDGVFLISNKMFNAGVGQYIGYVCPFNKSYGQGTPQKFIINVVNEVAVKTPDIVNISYPERLKGADFKGYDVDFSVSYQSVNTNFVNIFIGDKSKPYGKFSPTQSVDFNVQRIIKLLGTKIKEDDDEFKFTILLQPHNTSTSKEVVGKLESIQITFVKSDIDLPREDIVNQLCDAFDLNLNLFDDETSKYLTHLAHFGEGKNKLIANWEKDDVTFRNFKYDELRDKFLPEYVDGGFNALVLKMYEPLGKEIQPNQELFISKIITQPIIDEISIVDDSEEYCVPLKGPNFGVNDCGSPADTGFEIIDELVASGSQSSAKLIDTFVSSSGVDTKKLNIEYVSSSFDFIETEYGYSVDGTVSEAYRFDNFVHFGSAEERARNYFYKVSLLETYKNGIATIESSSGDATTSLSLLREKESLQKKINDVKANFDGFEHFLTDSTSSLAFPKESDGVSLQSTGSGDSVAWYNTLLVSSSAYDKDNVDYLANNIPQYIQNDDEQTDFILFLDMIGHHFDILWTYVTALKKNIKVEEKQRIGLSDDMLKHILKNYSWIPHSSQSTKRLWEYVLGFRDSKKTSKLVKSGKEYENTIWRRILNNLPYLLKHKGTRRGLSAVLSTYGIPSSLLTIMEFGGPRQQETQTTTFTFDDRTSAVQMPNDTDNSKILVDWKLENGVSSSHAVEVRFRTSNQHTQSLITNEPYWNVKLEHQFGNIGRLNFSSSFGEVVTTSGSLFNDEFTQFVINVNHHSASENGTSESIELVAMQDFQSRIRMQFSSSTDFTSSINEFFSGSQLSVGDGFTGSLDEFRIWSSSLSSSVIADHTLFPEKINGNHISSSTEDLMLRLDFEKPKNLDSNPSIPNVAPDTGSNGLIRYSTSATGSGFSDNSTYPFHYDVYDRQVTAKVPSMGFGPADKFRFESASLVQNLSYRQRATKKAFDTAPLDSNQLGIFLSPTKELNLDIIKSLPDFSIDDYIGHAGDQYKDDYPDLLNLRKYVFGRYNLNIYEYINIIKYIDKSLFETIKQMIPARVKVMDGLLIEPHFLERNKERRREPVAELMESKEGKEDVSRGSVIALSSSVEHKEVKLDLSDVVEFIETIPSYEAEISESKIDEVNANFNNFIGNITDTEINAISSSRLDYESIISDGAASQSLISELEFSNSDIIGIDPDGITNAGFGIGPATNGFIVRTTRDNFNNYKKEKLRVWVVKKEKRFKQKVQLNPLDSSLGTIVSESGLKTKTIVSFTSPSGSLTGSLGNIDTDGTVVQVTALNGYLPTHQKNTTFLPAGMENLYFKGCKQTQATTLDGTPPIEVFTTNPNTLKVSDSGRGSGEPILEIE